MPRFEVPALLLLLALAAAVHLPALDAPFVFDEENGIAGNRSLRPASPWSAALEYRYSPDQARPLFFASLLLDARLWGTGPRGFRTTGLVFHLIAGLLLHALLRRPPGGPAAALAGAALFLLHPLQSESVIYIWGRSEIQSTLFLLGALLLGLSAPDRRPGSGGGPRGIRWAAAILFAGLALAAKEEPVVLPLIAFVWWITAERRSVPGAFRAAGILAVPVVAFLAARGAALGEVGRQVYVRSLSDNILGQAVVTLRMIRLLLWPVGQSLDHDARVPDLPAGLGAVALCLAPVAAAVVILTRGAAGAARDRQAAAAASSRGPDRGTADEPGVIALDRIAGGVLVAAAGVVIYWIVPLPDLMCERRAYLPMAGAALALSGIVMWLESRLAHRGSPAGALALPLMVAALLAPMEYQRARVWSDPRRLWQEAADRAPRKARPLLNLGVLSARDRDVERALGYFDRAVALEPDNAEALFNRGRLRFDRGELSGASADFEAALTSSPRKVGARINLAAIRLRQNDLPGAEQELRTALALDPDEPRTLNNLAEILRSTGRTAEAITLYRRALAADPSYSRAAARLGVALEETGDRRSALAAYREYVARGAENPTDRDAVLKKIRALEESGAAAP